MGVMLGLDIIWLGFLARDHYHDTIGPLMRLDDAGHLNPVLPSVIAVYAVMSFGLNYFVHPYVSSAKQGLSRGAIYGAVLYGTYEFTNHAVLKGWDPAVIVPDLVWGMVLMALTGVIVHEVSEKMNYLS